MLGSGVIVWLGGPGINRPLFSALLLKTGRRGTRQQMYLTGPLSRRDVQLDRLVLCIAVRGTRDWRCHRPDLERCAHGKIGTYPELQT